MSDLKITINTRIETLKASERVTKLELSLISRELLQYIMGYNDVEATPDIDSVNRLLNVLTPMNKKTACLFFAHFLPYSFDETSCKFGGMQKKKAIKQAHLVPEFLDDDANDIWSWAEQNVKIEKKRVDELAQITKHVTKALDDDFGASAKDVLLAVLAGGVSGDDVIGILEALSLEQEIANLEQAIAA